MPGAPGAGAPIHDGSQLLRGGGGSSGEVGIADAAPPAFAAEPAAAATLEATGASGPPPLDVGAVPAVVVVVVDAVAVAAVGVATSAPAPPLPPPLAPATASFEMGAGRAAGSAGVDAPPIVAAVLTLAALPQPHVIP